MRTYLIALAFVAFAALLAATAQATTIELVTVGNTGNTGETSGTSNYLRDNTGAVAQTYRIGKYEVTASQYAEFLNAKAATDTYGLYNVNMATSGTLTSGCGILQSGTNGGYTYTVMDAYVNRPVNYVSFWDACRFVNWLHNGKGSGDTEIGAYTLNGENSSGGGTIFHNANAAYWIPTEDEWYKAAYYDPNKTDGAGYWNYATGADTQPGRDMSEVTNPGNNANYNGDPTPIDDPHYLTTVGEFQQSESPYGTFDQNGNVMEWTEGLAGYPATSTKRVYRGGAFSSSGTGTTSLLYAHYRNAGIAPNGEYSAMGFRVAAVIPEPGTLMLLATGLFGLLCYAWRKRK